MRTSSITKDHIVSTESIEFLSATTIVQVLVTEDTTCNVLTGTLDIINTNVRPTNSPVDNFDHNSDLMTELSSLGLTVMGSDNFIPRVMRKRLTVNFHNFSITFP